jgi:hypothetical protein
LSDNAGRCYLRAIAITDIEAAGSGEPYTNRSGIMIMTLWIDRPGDVKAEVMNEGRGMKDEG